jgi:hypothetical protein
MFERFLFRAATLPDSPEVRFFAEKIVEKQNRSLAFGVPKPTPFLDGKSSSQTQGPAGCTLAAPLPNARGVPAGWWQRQPWLCPDGGVAVTGPLLFPARLDPILVGALVRPSLPPAIAPMEGAAAVPVDTDASSGGVGRLAPAVTRHSSFLHSRTFSTSGRSSSGITVCPQETILSHNKKVSLGTKSVVECVSFPNRSVFTSN